MIKNIIKPLQSMKWKLLLAIAFTLIVPLIYTTLRMHYIGDMPNTYSFSIAGNLQWINIIFEVMEEMFLLPLFFAIHKTLKSKDANRKLVGNLFIITGIYLVLIIIFICVTPQLLQWISPKTNTPETIRFIRMEFGSRLFVMITKVFAIVLIALNMYKQIFAMIVLQTSMNAILDTFMISPLNVSAKLGITGVAIDDYITNTILIISYVIIASKALKLKWSDFRNPNFNISKEVWTQSLWSGLESFIRNAFFIWFVIKTINHLGSGYNQGDWWTTNTFIWTWLLLPIMALSQYTNRTFAFEDKTKTLWDRIGGQMILITISIVIWMAFIPTYEPFIRVVMNNPDSHLVAHLTIISLGFYVLFAFNEIIDKSFYGLGKTQYILIQSIITNVIVYIPFYYSVDHMTLDLVAVMFGTAMSVDALLTFGMFAWYWLKKRKGDSNEYCRNKKVLK